MSFRSGGAPDQYHAFTSRLAAAGYQTTSMRVVAGCILALSVPALLAGLEPSVAPWPGFRISYVGIAITTGVLATPWLRYRWPTRRESATVVVLGTMALAAGCLVTIDPMAGLLVAAAFCFVLGYTALFHSSRLLTFTIVVTALTVTWLAVRIGTHEPATAVAVVTPIVLLAIVVTFGCRTIATVGGSGGTSAEVEPVTGLLTREMFYERTATMLGARRREDDRYFVVAVVGVDALGAITSIHGARGAVQALVSIGQALREQARRDAVLGHVDESEFLIADTFTVPDPTPLIDRVLGAVASTPSGVTASIGVVTTPLRPLAGRPPHEVIDEVVALATTAMYAARRAGGNQARYVTDPPLGPGGE